MKNKENDLDGDGDDNDDDDDDKDDDDGGSDKDDDGNDDENEDLCKGRNQPWWPPSEILMMVMAMITMTTMTTMATKTMMMMMVMLRTRTFAKGGINRGGRHQRHRRCQDGRTFHRVHRQLPKTYLYILIHHQHDYSLGK